MQNWKRGTIICLGINLVFLYGVFTDYYEFFIKKCRDAFPFGYCPWGRGVGVATCHRWEYTVLSCTPIIKHPKRTFFYFLWFELTSE